MNTRHVKCLLVLGLVGCTFAMGLLLSASNGAAAATFTVLNTNDLGAGSLRQAIIDANTNPGTDTIVFNIPGSGVKTITIASALPAITEAVTVNGTTQPGFTGLPLIQLNGNSGAFAGLTITSGGSTIRGLIINRFGGSGIVLSSGGGNTITRNFIGTNAAGTQDLGNAQRGIQIVNSANNIIGGTAGITSAGPCTGDCNLISGNDGNGLEISGAASTGNQVQGNFVGTDVQGSSAIANSGSGVVVTQASGNTVGGLTAAARNLISGNNTNGVAITGASASGNLVQGNFIGSDAQGGNSFLGNLNDGVFITGPNNTIGGTTGTTRNGPCTGACNVISTNGANGIELSGANATGNVVQHNYIGCDFAGTVPMGNTGNGMLITSGANNNTIGGVPPPVPSTPSELALGPGVANTFCLQDNATGDTFTFNTLTGNFVYHRCSDDFEERGQGTSTASAYSDLTIFTCSAGPLRANVTVQEISGTGRVHFEHIGQFVANFNDTNIFDNSCDCGRTMVIVDNRGSGVQVVGSNSNQISYINLGVANNGQLLSNFGHAVDSINSPATAVVFNQISAFDPNSCVSVAGANGNAIDGGAFAGATVPIVLTSGANNNQPPPTLSTPTQISTKDVQSTVDATGPPNTDIKVQIYCKGGPAFTYERPTYATLHTDGTGHAHQTLAWSLLPHQNPQTTSCAATTTDSLNNTSQFSNAISVTLAPPNTTADLQISLSAETPVSVANNQTISVAAINNSSHQVTNVNVTVLTDRGSQVLVIDAGQGTYTNSGGLIDFHFGTINSFGFSTALIFVKPLFPGTTNVFASGLADQIDPQRNNNDAQVQTTIVPAVCASGNIFPDITFGLDGNYNSTDGTIIGSPQGGASFVLGKSGQGLHLNGNDGSVSLSNTAALDSGTGNFSIMTWVKFRSFVDQVFIENLSQPDRGYSFGLKNNRLRFLVTQSATNQNDLQVPVSLFANIWYQLTAVHEGNTNRIYINQNLTQQQAAGNNIDTGTGGTVKIGRAALLSQYFADADFDEVSVGHVALTAQDVDTLYKASLARECDDNLIATVLGFPSTVHVRDATITYGGVTASGVTTDTPIIPEAVAPLPANFTQTGLAYDISTTATYSGPVDICFHLPLISDFNTFNLLKVFHEENGSLVDRTTTSNFPARSLCAQVNSLSPFVIAQGSNPTAAPGTISGRITTSDSSPLAGVTVTLSSSIPARTITDSNGYYSFQSLETNNFYTVTPQLANFSFLPAQRSFSLLGSGTEALFTAIPDAVPTSNPLDNTDFFVRQQYLDFLDREPDQGGFNYWSGEINNCHEDRACTNNRRTEVSAAFFAEPEAQQTSSFIYRLYKVGLSRQPRYAEFVVDRAALRGGPGLSEDQQVFAHHFVSRIEFLRAYEDANSASSFVDKVLVNIRRSSGVDLSTERAALIRVYESGTSIVQSRSDVLLAVIANAAFRTAEYNSAFVLMEYFGYLRRDPDAGGYAFWLDVLNNRVPENYRSMVCAFVTSEEYQRRFSPVMTRSNRDCGP